MTQTVTHLGEYEVHPDLVPFLAPIDDAKPHPGNPKIGDLDAIKASMAKHGVFGVIRVQKSTGHIIAGRHTWQALVDAGADRAPFVWLDVDDEMATSMRLADNRTAELGGYDNQLLLDALREVEDLTGTGYTSDYLEHLEKVLAEAAEGIDYPDEFPEFDGDIDTAYGCPSCGYSWSGNPNPGRGTHTPPDDELDSDDDDELPGEEA